MVAPSVSIKDRTVVGPAEQVLNVPIYILVFMGPGSRCNLIATAVGCSPSPNWLENEVRPHVSKGEEWVVAHG